MVTRINKDNLREELNKISSKKFNKELAKLREKEEAALNELAKVEKGEDYNFDIIYDLVFRLSTEKTLYKGLMLGYTALRGRTENIAKGRRIGRSSTDISLYESIYRNENRKPRSVSEFCKEHNISRSKYNRIAKNKIKNKLDREFLFEIKARIINGHE